MNFFKKLIEIVVISVVFIAISNSLIINSVLANNIPAGFGAETKIFTPTGNIAVENLQSGDRVIGYNFETHQSEENIVSKVSHKSSLSYYLINNKTKITGTSSLFVKTKDNPKLSTVQQLKLQTKLFSQNHTSISTRTVIQIVKPTEIYYLHLDNPIGNLFVDNLLVHDGDRLPGLFRKQYSKCEFKNRGTYNYYSCANINSDNVADFAKALTIIITGIVILGKAIAKLLIYIRYLFRFAGKSFTENTELIEFTKSINPKFTNKYSIEYLKSYEVWHKIDLQPDIDWQKYQRVINKEDLLEQISNLYHQYHRDLVHKRLENIEKYFTQFSQQEKYQKYYREQQYIIYRPNIIEAAIIDFESEADDTNVFTIQINAEIIYFAISDRGYILTGEPKTQQYSEYWDIKITSDKCSIAAINDTLTTRILEGDLRAKLEAYGDSFVGG